MDLHGRVPVISLQDPAETLPEKIGGALERIGFVVVTDHGIPDNIIAAAYAQAARVFDLPDAAKLKYERLPDHQVGYTPMGVEKAKDSDVPDLKEFWQVRTGGAALPEEIPEFGKIITYLARQLTHLGNELLGYVGDYLGKPKDFFREWTRDGQTMTRVIHYPEIRDGDVGVRSSAHEDINLITLLPYATAPGLDVKTRAGEWIEVVNPPGAIIVNAGDMLQEATGHRMRSATHRVRNQPGRRYSIPHFVHPRAEVVLNPRTGLTAGEYLRQRLIQIGMLKE